LLAAGFASPARFSKRLHEQQETGVMEAASQAQAVALTETKTSVRWKIFLMMLMLISINYIDRASLSVAMPLIAKEFDIGPAVQGLLLSSFSGRTPSCRSLAACWLTASARAS